MTEKRIEQMTDLLQRHLNISEIDIIDESHKHAGHAGARDGRGHFRLSLRAEEFTGLNTLQRHRLVYDILGDMMKTDIHALSITASEPNSTQTP